MTVAVTRMDLSARELRAASSKTRDAKAARRMLAIALVLEGMDRKTARTCPDGDAVRSSMSGCVIPRIMTPHSGEYTGKREDMRMDGLERFLAAQDGVYSTALTELRAGQKQTHWMCMHTPQRRHSGS